jgi:hypothetical protein
LPSSQLREGCDAGICAARVIAAPDYVGDVTMDADPVGPPRGLKKADREALDEVCNLGDLIKYEPLRCRCVILGGGDLSAACNLRSLGRF